MEKPSIREIRATYSQEKMVLERRHKIGLFYLGRFPSFYVAWVFLRLNISANQATLICIAVGLASSAFLALGSYVSKLIGALLVLLYLMLDCVDGNIARYRKSSSPYGEFMDALSGYLVIPFLFIGLGLGAFVSPDSLFLFRYRDISLILSNEGLFLTVGLWSSFSYVLARLILLRYRSKIVTSLEGHISKNRRRDRFFQIISIIARNIFGISGFFVPLLLLAVVFRLRGLLTLFYGVVNTIALIFVLVRTAMKMEIVRD